MKKLLMSILLCMSVFFVFGCSSNETETYENENDAYEESLEDDDMDTEEFVDEEEAGEGEEIVEDASEGEGVVSETEPTEQQEKSSNEQE